MAKTVTSGVPAFFSCAAASSSTFPIDAVDAMESSQTAVGNASTFFRRAASEGEALTLDSTFAAYDGST